MGRHGVQWKQLGTHNKHLSVLDFEKQERQKEVAELEQTISGSKEELSDILHQQIAAGQGTELLLPVHFGGQLPALLRKLYALDSQIFNDFFQFLHKR